MFDPGFIAGIAVKAAASLATLWMAWAFTPLLTSAVLLDLQEGGATRERFNAIIEKGRTPEHFFGFVKTLACLFAALVLVGLWWPW